MLKLSNLETIGRPVYNFHNLHSVDFDGVDDFIQLGEPLNYTQHTISTWVKITATDDVKTIIDARDGSDDGVRIRVDASENIIYELNTSDLTSTNTFAGEWVHIVATYDGTTQKLYINGSLDQSATTSQTISTVTKAKIGSRNFNTRANEFVGKIDELAIFDRALTADEVTAIFRIKYGANLVQNGRFDELGSELVPSIASIVNAGGGTITQISGNSFSSTSDGTSGSSIRPKFDFATTSGKTYKLIITPTGSITGTVNFDFFDGSSYIFQNYDFTTTKEIYFTDNGDVFGAFDGTQSYSITGFTISVKQVDPNDRWTLPTGGTFADSKVVFTSASGSFYQSLQVFSEGTKIRVHFTVTNYSSGSIKPLLFGGSSSTGDTVISENGTFTQILTAGAGVNANFGFFLTSNTSLELSNVMVEEQKYVATNLKLKSTLFNPFTGSTLNLKNYYRFGDGILDTFPYINDMVSPSLTEITSTNLVTHSTDLDSSFAKSNVTLESNALISPDGTQNASYVKATSSTSVHLISDVVGTNDVIAMSIHAKQGGYTRFRFNSGSSSNGFASFNIANGTVVSTGGTYFYNADIEDVGDGWYRCKMVLIGSPGTGLTVAIEDDSGQVSYTGEPSKGIYFWGAQGEVQRQVTPLITTTGSTVTRTATVENVYGSMINMTEADITNDVPG